MTYTITPGPHPNIMIMEITDDLTYEAMTADEALGLNKGKPVYVLLDVSHMNVGLPEGFLDGAKKSYFMNENLKHMALYTDSGLLKLIGEMVAKVTRRKERLTVHNNRALALIHLEKLIKEAGIR